MCIDTFHKNPSHQRQILADPTRLPIRTEITIGHLKVALLVNGAFDAKSNHVGNILEWRDVTAERLNAGMLDAINKAQAVIEFSMDGKIQHANENFLKTLGYTLDEVKGQHHSMFVDPAYRQSPDYRMFWDKLGRGEYDAGQYKRIAKGGREVWIQASYNPILDANGKPFKVVKYATDITQQKLQSADYEGQTRRDQQGAGRDRIWARRQDHHANDNFLKVLGYTLDEVKGRHHSMFVEHAYRQSPDYRMFWEKLGRGEYDAGQYKRITKTGAEIWIQASYNPILDVNGKPFKVVKYATDITASVKASQVLQQAVQQVQEAVEAAKANDLTAARPARGQDSARSKRCAPASTALSTRWRRSSRRSEIRRARSPAPRRKSRRAPPIFRSGRKSRPQASRKRRPRWSKCPRPSKRMRRTRSRPTNRLPAPVTSPIAAVRSSPRPSTRWRGSRNPRARSPTSSA